MKFYSSLKIKLTYDLFSESPNKCPLIYVQWYFGQIITIWSLLRHTKGMMTYFNLDVVHAYCTWPLHCSLWYLLSFPWGQHQFHHLTHWWTQCSRCPVRIIDRTSACRHPGSDGWLGLCVMEPFPSILSPNLHSLASNRDCKPEHVQLCASF